LNLLIGLNPVGGISCLCLCATAATVVAAAHAFSQRLKHFLDFQRLSYRFQHGPGISSRAVEPGVGAGPERDDAGQEETKKNLDVGDRFFSVGRVTGKGKGNEESSEESDDNQGRRLHGF